MSYLPVTKEEFGALMATCGFQEVRVIGTDSVYEREKPETNVRVVVYSGLHGRVRHPKPTRVVLALGGGPPPVTADPGIPGNRYGRNVWAGRPVARTVGWESELLDRMREAWWRISRERCRCGYLMLVRDSSYGGGRFLGCTRYPWCDRGRGRTLGPQVLGTPWRRLAT